MKVSDPISDKLRDIKIQIKKIETSLAMNEMRGENNTFSMRTRLTHEFIYFDRFFLLSLSLSLNILPASSSSSSSSSQCHSLLDGANVMCFRIIAIKLSHIRPEI